MATTRIKLSPEAVSALKRQQEKFRARFGRDPGPNDPVFFDERHDEPRKIERISTPLALIHHKAPVIVNHVTVGFEKMTKELVRTAGEIIGQGLKNGLPVKPHKQFDDRATFLVSAAGNFHAMALAELLKAIRSCPGVAFTDLWGADQGGMFTYECDEPGSVTFHRMPGL